ncbi:MAG: class I SAM-dependent methyltransferase, partial [Leptospiraceae bacterium]|nr:class I SAM-dependent methyltransferase [Leptospiraceae bacterium]
MNVKMVFYSYSLVLFTSCNPAGHCGQMPHRFISAEQWAERFDAPERDAWQKPDDIVEAMEMEPGMFVADVGAGTGYMLEHLSAAVGPQGQVLAIDIEPDMIAYMQKRIERSDLSNCAAQLGRADDPGLATGRFDRVLILNTWHHISDRTEFARKIRSGLSIDGRLIIVDFAPGAGGEGPPDRHRLSLETVRQELESAGFSV